ncbi:MAG: sugar phosphate isomerase/epimerase, partial [Pirellulales bacterium]|nr:sugar phosphate isomerase/epimerase [Pirellulales bacterium]
TARHARRLFVTALEELLPVASDLRIDLALEIIHPACASKWTTITDISDAIELLDEMAHPSLKIALDTYHVGHDDSALARLEAIATDVSVVHLADGHGVPEEDQHRCLLGEGDRRLAEIVAALTQGGFDGDYDVELIGEEIERLDYEYVLQHSQVKFDSLMRDAAMVGR